MPRPSQDPEVLLQHAGFVRALAREVVFDAELARDVEQETWLRALQHAPRDLRSPRAWLAAIVRSVAQRAGQRASSRRDAERRLERERRDAAEHDGFPSPDELLAREQARRALVGAVMGLEEPLRGTIVLHYFDGLALREVALRTGVPLETARSRVKRGLARLREELGRSQARSESWSVALVGAFALDPPHLVRGLSLFSRGLLPFASTMTTTHKVATALAALVLCLASGWYLVAREDPPAPAQVVADGAIEIARPPAGDIAPPAESTTARAVAAEPTRAPAAVTSELGRLRLHVVWAEDLTPAARVGIRLDAQPGVHGGPRRATTGEDGRVEIDALPPSNWMVRPIFGGFALADVVAGETAEIEVEIPQGIAISGSVVDAAGVPVSNASIFLSSGAIDPQYELALVAQSDRGGRFELRSAPAQVGACLSARAPDRAPTAQSMLAGAPRSRAEVRLVFEAEGVRVSGRVVGPTGSAIGGAQVLVGSDREIAFLPRPDGTAALAPIAELVETDGDGRFELDGVALGSLRVQARAHGFGAWSGTLDTRATNRIDVHMDAAATIRGTVRGAGGQPIAGAEIATEGTSFFARSAQRSGADGAFALQDLAGGALRVHATAGERGSTARTFDLAPGVVVAWDPELGGGGLLRGRVEAADGPLDGWRVRGFHRFGPDESAAGQRDYVSETTTDAEGRFVLRDCPPVVDLALFGRGGTPFPVARLNGARAGPAEVVLRPDPALVPSARIRGRLVDAQRQPVRNADVTAVHTLWGSTLIHSDVETGRIEFDRLPPGEWCYFVDAHVAGWAPQRSEPRTLAAGETWDVGDIVVGAGGTLVVRLRRTEGVEGGATQVVVTGENQQPVQWLEIDADVARSRPLPPGRYRVTLLGLRGAAVTATEVTIVAGEESRANFELERGQAVTLHVKGLEDLQPASRAVVRLRNDAGALVWWGEVARASEDVVQLRWELRPGTYRAEVAAPDRPAAWIDLVVAEAGQPEQVFEVVLPRR